MRLDLAKAHPGVPLIAGSPKLQGGEGACLLWGEPQCHSHSEAAGERGECEVGLGLGPPRGPLIAGSPKPQGGEGADLLFLGGGKDSLWGSNLGPAASTSQGSQSQHLGTLVTGRRMCPLDSPGPPWHPQASLHFLWSQPDSMPAGPQRDLGQRKRGPAWPGRCVCGSGQLGPAANWPLGR